MDDRDLEDAAFWSMIDSAAAAAALNKPRLPPPSPLPSNQFQFRPPCRTRPKSELGEVVQPEKKPKLIQDSNDRRIVVSKNQMQIQTPVVGLRPIDGNWNPNVASPGYRSPEKKRIVVNQVSPLIESPSPEVSKYRSRHSLLIGDFPSVATFKQYQDMALQILDKSDYTVISGNPYIKKSGWRKMSFFFNISYEIKDKTIEFDENRNVRRAEFLVRAHMQGGRYSDGWGSCEQREKRFNKPNHDIPSTAETRAKNKACQVIIIIILIIIKW
ncbi:hypothetical protein LUZ60_012950 [Juncus effusus]|nr:hypothetical protein LUZ60_012950 [Juncus effusus]